jgi:lysophospholipase L1-like esterase
MTHESDSAEAPEPVDNARRQALRAAVSWAVISTGSATTLSACGGNSADVAPAPAPTPAPPAGPPTSVQRLKSAVLSARVPAVRATPPDITQGAGNAAAPALGPTAVILPTPQGFFVNPNPLSLATLDQVWGHARQTWVQRAATYIGTTASNASWFVPVTVVHPSATAAAGGFCGLHFNFTGRTLEVLFGGTDVFVTLMVDGQYATPRFISTQLVGGVAGAPLTQPNTYVQFDLGSRASRKISLYARSSQGPCAIATAAQDSLSAWDRSDEPVMFGMSDSYAGSFSPNWAGAGIFHEAALAMGIPHVDINGIGGTGYAQNNVFSNAGDTFGARIASMSQVPSDLFLTAGGINDNNWLALFPYSSAEAARLGFEAAVQRYFRDLRAALPSAVLAATGPWQPDTTRYPELALHKMDTIASALAAVAGPWVLLDNLRGSWVNSAGARSPAATGAWQTGTGNVANRKGDGNGDLYVSADGTHPSEAGATYLGQQIAQNLRAAILAL